ncbi:hypothetical protein AJ80_09896, partial [Polytolypa hystricis UAMH7299]
MPQNILLLQYFLPLSAVSLRQFTTSIEDPHRDFHNPICDTSPDTITKIQDQYTGTHQSVHHQKFTLQLIVFLLSSFSRCLKADFQIMTDQTKTYTAKPPIRYSTTHPPAQATPAACIQLHFGLLQGLDTQEPEDGDSSKKASEEAGEEAQPDTQDRMSPVKSSLPHQLGILFIIQSEIY